MTQNFRIACEPLIRECCRQVAQLPGCAAEIGVWKGESAAIIADELTCDLHLFDTFCGIPPGVAIKGLDGHLEGQFKDTSLDVAKKRMELYLDRTHWHVGIFPNTACEIPDGLKFVHIDCDLYTPTAAALEWAWAWLVAGGIILDDDYGASFCRGARKAVDEFAADKGIDFRRSGSRAVIQKAFQEAIA